MTEKTSGRTKKPTRRILKTKPCLALSLAFISSAAIAQQIDWYSIDGGGGMSSGNGIELIGVIGQTDTVRMRGGSISLSGGYLPLPVAEGGIFKDSFE